MAAALRGIGEPDRPVLRRFEPTWASWAATVADNPLPVGIALVDVSELLTAERFPSDPDIDAKRENLLNAITDYGLDVSDGIVETRSQPANSEKDESVYRFAQLERREFIASIGGSSYFALYSTANGPDDSDMTSAFFLQPRDGGTSAALRSGDVAFLGYTFFGGHEYLNRVAGNNGVRHDSLDADSKNFQWRILTAVDPSGTGDPIAQGTPLLVQNLGNGKVLVWSEISSDHFELMATGDPQSSPLSGRMAFV